MKTVTLSIPTKAWDLLEETLQMDSVSIAFSPCLRKSITKALKSVAMIETPRVLVEVLGGVANVEHDPGVEVEIVDYDDTPDARPSMLFQRLLDTT